jgi:hypothetical protein
VLEGNLADVSPFGAPERGSEADDEERMVALPGWCWWAGVDHLAEEVDGDGGDLASRTTDAAPHPTPRGLHLGDPGRWRVAVHEMHPTDDEQSPLDGRGRVAGRLLVGEPVQHRRWARRERDDIADLTPGHEGTPVELVRPLRRRRDVAGAAGSYR